MRFGRYTVISRVDNQGGNARWECKCDCGTVKNIRADALKNRNVSCGCYSKENPHTTHDMTYSREYKSFQSMCQRCLNKQSRQYCDYGGRGINICDQWIGNFSQFFKDMGVRPVGTSLDRIKNELGYSPENCRWATPLQQCRNRRNNRIIFGNGKSQTLAEWSIELGIPYSTLNRKIKQGDGAIDWAKNKLKKVV